MTGFSLVTRLTAKKAKTPIPHGLTSDQTFVTKSKRYCGTTGPEIQQNRAKTIINANKALIREKREREKIREKREK